jgi:inner membrane protein
MTNPTILNNFLWYSIVNSDSTLKIGEYSLFQHNKPIVWRSYPINQSLLENCESKDAAMLTWFSQGYCFTLKNQDTLEVFIPKFGRGDLDKTAPKQTFLFYYKLYQQNGEWIMDAHQPSNEEMKFKEAFAQLVRKIRGID